MSNIVSVYFLSLPSLISLMCYLCLQIFALTPQRFCAEFASQLTCPMGSKIALAGHCFFSLFMILLILYEGCTDAKCRVAWVATLCNDAY